MGSNELGLLYTKTYTKTVNTEKASVVKTQYPSMVEYTLPPWVSMGSNPPDKV